MTVSRDTALVLETFDDLRATRDADASALEVTLTESARSRIASAEGPWGQEVLVLGGTGFVGVHLIHALLSDPSVARVHAIVRGDTADAAADRVRKAGTRYGLRWPERVLDKLDCTPGQILEPQFGLDDPRYERLMDRVDTVLHAAGEPNYLVPYEGHQQAWVGQVLRTVDFCISGRVKQLTYVGSTIARLYTSHHDFVRTDSWWHCGYSLMKWVNQHTLRRLLDTGLRITVCEAPYILGSTVLGKDPGLRYAFWRGVRVARALGMLYEGPGPNYTPIDLLCRAVIHNARAASPRPVLRPSNPVPYTNALIADLIGSRLVTWERFHAEVKQRLGRALQRIFVDLPTAVALSNAEPIYPEGFDIDDYPSNEMLMSFYLAQLEMLRDRSVA